MAAFTGRPARDRPIVRPLTVRRSSASENSTKTLAPACTRLTTGGKVSARTTVDSALAVTSNRTRALAARVVLVVGLAVVLHLVREAGTAAVARRRSEDDPAGG